MKIQVNADELQRTGREMEQVLLCLRENMNQLESTIQRTEGDWQGAFAKAYADRLICIRQEFRELEEFFREYSSMLMHFAEEYLHYERELSKKIMDV